MKYLKISTDEEGETHYEEIKIYFESIDTKYSELPIFISSIRAATKYAFFRFPSGLDTDWHTTSHRQLMFILSGEMELQVSDCESRYLRSGSIVLTEDKTGKGHKGKVLGSEDVVGVAIQLPD